MGSGLVLRLRMIARYGTVTSMLIVTDLPRNRVGQSARCLRGGAGLRARCRPPEQMLRSDQGEARHLNLPQALVDAGYLSACGTRQGGEFFHRWVQDGLERPTARPDPAASEGHSDRGDRPVAPTSPSSSAVSA